MKLPGRIDAATPKGVGRDGLFTAGHGTRIAEQTAAFAIRSCAGSAHHVFWNPYAGPIAIINGGNTWSNFQLMNGTGEPGAANVTVPCDFPWHHQLQQAGIVARLRFTTASKVPIKIRMQVVTLIDAVATSTGEGVTNEGWSPQTMTFWDRFGGEDGTDRTRRSGTAVVRVDSPTMPATRRVGLRLQAQVPAETASYLIPNVTPAGGIAVHIESAQFYDVADPNTYG